ncbi:MAG TPA: phasin family protein [Rubrivivax sp.]|nr:phasin family protein [Rubrivivax sp.]
MKSTEAATDTDTSSGTSGSGTSSTGSEAGSSGSGGKYSSLLDSQLASSVKESAQQIWLAGMGAFAKAQEEGSKVFEALVAEGSKLQKKTQGMAEDKIGEVTGKMSAMADTVTSRAGQNWDKLEAIFEQRTAKALGKLGVPTASDVDVLMKRVDDLAATVAKMGQSAGSRVRSAATAAAGSRAKPAAKTAAKPAAKTAATSSAASAKRARKSSEG